MKSNEYRFLLALIFTVVLVSCSQKKNIDHFKKPWFTISTKFGFNPNERQYKTLQNGTWTRYRDHFFNEVKTNLLIQTIVDTVSSSPLTTDNVFYWAYNKSDDISIDDTLNINGLYGFKCSGTVNTYDIATKEHTVFYETSWILQGEEKIFFIKLNSHNKEKYEQSLMNAIKTVGTIRELK